MSASTDFAVHFGPGTPTRVGWDGSYWFDKGNGTGGARLRNFQVGGQPSSPDQAAAAIAPLSPELAAAQPLIGAVTHAVVGTIGQQDPSNWSDPSAIVSMFNSQKSAISAALPPEVSRALGASGLLAGLGGAAAAAA